jgi:hypothetical protein
MNPDRIWIALLVLAALVIGANLLAFGLLRGAKHNDFDVLRRARDSLVKPSSQDAAYDQLRQKVQRLQQKGDDPDQTG